jgi:DNA-binding transcriptional LysR family regulator
VHAALVGHDRVTLVVAGNYPLAARAGRTLRPRDVLGHPFLMREPGSGTRDTFLSAMGALPEQTVELGSTATIVATALAGGGIGVVSSRAVDRQIAEGSLVELHLANMGLHRPLHAVWTGPRLVPLAAELVQLARDCAD